MTTSTGVSLDPWVDEKSGESDEALRARVRQRGEDYLKSWSDSLGARGAETTLGFLYASASNQAIARVRSMIVALKTFLAHYFQNDRLNQLHLPTRICAHDGRQVVTSPVLIATTAIAYSQTDWYRRRFHDLRSASRAEDLLDGWDFPAEMIRAVALLVGLKNVVRTSIGQDKEVGVWNGSQLLFEDERLAKCFAALLQDRFPTHTGPSISARAAADALVLVTAAYEARMKSPTPELLKEVEAFGTRLRADVGLPASECGTLVAVEFSKFSLPDSKGQRVPFMESVAGKFLGSITRQTPFMLWISLDRFWSTMHPTALSELGNALADHIEPWVDQEDPPLLPFTENLLGPGSTVLCKLVLQGDDAFKVIYGRCPPPGATIWECAAITLEIFRKSRGSISRIPTAYLARQLEILAYCYPEKMFELRVHGDERAARLSAYTSLWLPKEPPTKSKLEALVTGKAWSDPILLVARYAASMVMNRSIGFGYPARVFESLMSSAPVPQWIELIQAIADKNSHGDWFKYLGKYRAAPPFEPYYVLQRIQVAATTDPLILGVDIGGTYTKVALYGYEPKTGALSAPRCEHRFATKNSGGQQYRDAAAFVERLDNELLTAKKASGSGERAEIPLWPHWVTDRDHIVAIGVTWPGAVAGRPGLEYVAANSTALTYFAPYPPKKHWDADAAEIRRLRLREAFAIHFRHGGSYPYVRLVNDAVAHVLFERWQLVPFAPRLGEIVVGLTAGTGSGMAVLDPDSGHPLDALAEVGRLITHISDPFPTKAGDPPVGQGRDAFNSKTLGVVATKLLKLELLAPATAGRFLRRKLDASPAAASQILNQALSAPEECDAAVKLPLVPSLLISWLIEENHAVAPASETKKKFEDMWASEEPKEPVELIGTTLESLREKLRAFLLELECPHWPDEYAFAAEVVRQAGWELADLIATTASLFGATNVITGGGPLSDYVGQELRASARQALIDDYKYEVPASATTPGVKAHRLARLLRLPEPQSSAILTSRPAGPSGPYGAAATAAELLHE